LSDVATKYGFTLPELQAANPKITDTNAISRDTLVNIPVYLPSQGELNITDTCPTCNKRSVRPRSAKFAARDQGSKMVLREIYVGPHEPPIQAYVVEDNKGSESHMGKATKNFLRMLW